MLETFMPSSSNINRVDYDSDAKTMVIEFKDGEQYQYENVPYEAFLGIQNARSAGSYFHAQIKSRYAYSQV